MLYLNKFSIAITFLFSVMKISLTAMYWKSLQFFEVILQDVTKIGTTLQKDSESKEMDDSTVVLRNSYICWFVFFYFGVCVLTYYE